MEIRKCPECGSTNLVIYGSRVWINREQLTNYRCKDCGRLTVYPVIEEIEETELVKK